MIFSVFGAVARSSTKLFASFLLVIAMMVLAFAYAPGLIRQLQDWIESINDLVRTPPLLKGREQGLILYRTLVNENTIFGILMTLLARTIVEIVAWIFGGLFGMNKKN